MTHRDDLVQRYLATTDGIGHPITTHVDNVEAELIVDGHQYFTEVFAAIAATKPGDSVLLVGWTFDPNMTKTTATKIGDILAERKFHGVNVHIVLNGSLYQNLFGTPFDQSLRALIDLREKRIPSGATTPPLDPCVLFDFSGAGLTGSHHQKVVVVHDAAANDSVAFIGGIDFWPNRDDTTDHPGTVLKLGGQPWGWHDAAMRVRGQPVADAWANFESRYEETRLLPVKNAWRWNPGGLFPFKLQPYNPSPGAALPPKPAVFTATTPNPDIAVQVLRSRFPVKLQRESPPLLWGVPPTGGIRQTYATLHKAIGAAKRYIYIEDQFIADTFDGDDAGAKTVSLLPDLLAALLAPAAERNVKIILLTSGKPEGPSLPALPPRNMQNAVIDKLTPAQQENVSIWKLSDLVVHSKIILIDDEFAAVGSANMHSRSMWGIDQELHVAVVDAKVANNKAAGVVRDWRVRLWTEHLEVIASTVGVRAALENLDTALGMWRKSWLVGGTPGMWFETNNPPGFAPTKIRREFVGPPPNEP